MTTLETVLAAQDDDTAALQRLIEWARDTLREREGVPQE